jgi:hypothetical protein
MGYVYPFAEFLRDLGLVTPSPNAVLRGWAHDQAAIDAYMHRTYPAGQDATERAVALSMIISYIHRHREIFDTGLTAIYGQEQTAISHDLLRAVHSSLCPFVFGDTDDAPSPADVLALAQSYAENQPQ